MLGTARIVRADRGTENVKVEILQKFFRADGRDSFAAEKSFMYGKSTTNQVKLISVAWYLYTGEITIT